MTNSQNTSAARCFSHMLRRLLCTGSSPTHPSVDDFVDCQTEEIDPSKQENSKLVTNKVQATVVPGIVARLMGLDTMPDVKRVPKRRALESLRSVNSADYLPQVDLVRYHHRRVKTSSSCRQIPTLSLYSRNHEFSTVYVGETKKTFNGRKSEEGFEVMKQKKIQNQVNKRKEEFNRVPAIRTSSKVINNVFLLHHKKEYANRKTKTIFKAKGLQNSRGLNEVSGGSERKNSHLVATEVKTEYCATSGPVSGFEASLVCPEAAVSEKDVREWSSWVTRELVTAVFEEICLHLGKEILDKQLNQVVCELVELE